MKVMLVEDSRVLRDRIRGMIAAIPRITLVAEVGNESDALSYLDKSRPDVVVIDLKLTSGSGLSVLEHIKAVYPAMIAIVLTNYGQPEYRNKCMALGADYFFDKTKNIDEFNDLLATLPQTRFAQNDTEVVPSIIDGLK